jgi:mono/diheme cytochrome c family protein
MNFKLLFIPILLAVAWFSLRNTNFGSSKIDYSNQVKPIINKHCISCHGGVKQQGGLSLLFRNEALAKTKSGHPAIVPFHPEKSDFIKRLTHTDPEERMPYKADPLKKEEIEILTQWIKEGAEWGDHWAYTPTKMPEVPNKGLFSSIFSLGRWENNDIDYFIKEKLDDNNLKPQPEADRNALIRRVCLDLTGLPPTTELFKKYEKNDADNWYEQLVDELLASKTYGERWASMWLDLARYSDSRGYQKDNGRNIWRYRDWTIDAFNADMPFDKFTTEQLAGDLLPNPSKNQLIATAFHRNTMNNDETGTVDEEFRVAAVIDRINTTFDVFQGTTFACVQCHSHPYDPFKHDEYYKMMAFFNNTRDEDTIDEAPNWREFSDKDEIKLKQFIKTLPSSTGGGTGGGGFEHFIRTLEPRHHAHYADNYVNGTLAGDRNIAIRHNGSCRLPSINLTNKAYFLMAYSTKEKGGVLELHKGSPTGELLASIKLDTSAKTNLIFIPINKTEGKHDVYLTAKNPRLKPEQDVFQSSWFKFMEDIPVEFHQELKYFINVRTNNTPIMLASDPDYVRPTHVFERGNWLVHGKEVKPEPPHSLNKFTNYPKNRLGLAQWITNKDNPLTARTVVNRFWEQLFGTGLVETIEDFGTQGARPTHPELLDYLAVTFSNEYKWSMKKLLKLMVMSATYRQASVNETQSEDPYNKYLSRNGRVRLTAEMVRDQALSVSGILNDKMYGKPVLPYQPDGVWQAVNSNLNYKISDSSDRYRRAVYTFARRTGPYPSMFTFDSPSREICMQRRIRTNTPLQALVLLNDPVFVEASKNLAKWTIKTDKSIENQIKNAYFKTIFKEIEKKDLKALTNLYELSLKKFKANPKAINQFLSTPYQKEEHGTNHLAAMTVVTNAMMNLDEFVTK